MEAAARAGLAVAACGGRGSAAPSPVLTSSPFHIIPRWKPVTMDGAAFTEAGEAGFAGLEELSGPAARALLAGLAPEKEEVTGEAALRAKVAALEAENATLRAKAGGGKKGGAADAATDAGGPPSPKKKKKKNKTPKPAPNLGAAAGGGAPSARGAAVDTTAWAGLGLSPPLLAALGDAGFGAPTPVQALALPAALAARRDVLAAAATGSGKTLAFGLPLLQRLLDEGDCELPASPDSRPPASRLRALVLAPTRELALQVAAHLLPLATAVGARVATVVGGLAAPKQARMLARGPHVVVATPGRLADVLRSGDPHMADLGGLRVLVLDEADRMAEQGAAGDLGDALACVRSSAPLPTLQTFVSSATLTLPPSMRGRVRKGGGGAGKGGAALDAVMAAVPLRGDPAVVDATPANRLAAGVVESVARVDEDGRDALLLALLHGRVGRSLIFVNALSAARRLTALLRHLSLPVHSLHAGMQQRARLRSLDAFAAAGDGVLVATDVAARGLDVPGVTLVAHYQIPATADTYVHRCGRTGRAGGEGLALALVTPAEAGRWAALLAALGRGDNPPKPYPAAPGLMAAAGARVRAAAAVDALDRAAAKAGADGAWRARAAEEAGIDLSDEEEVDSDGGDDGGKRVAAAAAAVAARAKLARLLSVPLAAAAAAKPAAKPPKPATGKRLRAAGAPAAPGADFRARALAVALARATSGGAKRRGRLVVVGSAPAAPAAPRGALAEFRRSAAEE